MDARAKLIALLVFLTAVATTAKHVPRIYGGYFALLAAALFMARLPVLALLTRAAWVLPFTAIFAAMTWWAGDFAAALILVVKSFLSILAALTLAASTPWTRLLDALQFLRVPRPLLLVIQFLARYLFVVGDQVAHMRQAAYSRGGANSAHAFQAAAGAIGVLFARSWERADGIYQAMLARGFTGRFPAPGAVPFVARDAAFLCLSIAATVLVRLAL
jgi:cobalt/nickel transport system permease protein